MIKSKEKWNWKATIIFAWTTLNSRKKEKEKQKSQLTYYTCAT
jgi:hypothetical protein